MKELHGERGGGRARRAEQARREHARLPTFLSKARHRETAVQALVSTTKTLASKPGSAPRELCELRHMI